MVWLCSSPSSGGEGCKAEPVAAVAEARSDDYERR
jgi:hypothetical protein